jgi:hypothetical protein
MSKRDEHTFQFTGKQVGDAAAAECKYHEGRRSYWNGQYEAAVEAVKSATVKVREYDVTGGKRAEVAVDFAETARLNEASKKRDEHRVAADRYRIEAATYLSQPDRAYELDGADVGVLSPRGGPKAGVIVWGEEVMAP